MNIFVTHKSPLKSAIYLDDKRLVKMCLETAQMLSTAVVIHCSTVNGVADLKTLSALLGVYKPTHANHPCNVWCRATRGNYNWLLVHFRSLCNEYKRRYGRQHASFGLLKKFQQGAVFIPEGKRTPFVNCAANSELGIDFKHVEDVHKAYRQYLGSRWLQDKKPAKCIFRRQ